jgi:hypothetical protein
MAQWVLLDCQMRLEIVAKCEYPYLSKVLQDIENNCE